MGGAFSSGQSQIHHGRFEKVIYKVADAITDDEDLRRLGLELGLRHSVIFRAITKNWEYGPRSIDGNIVMLRRWANTIKRSDSLIPTLKAALVRAGLREIAETCTYAGESANLQSHPPNQSASAPEPNPDSFLGGSANLQSHPPSQSASAPEINPGENSKTQSHPRSQSASELKNEPGENPKTQRHQRSQNASELKNEPGTEKTMPDDIKKLREKLKARYLKKYGEIRTSPVDPDSCAWLRKIFVSLVLILRSSVSMNAEDERIDFKRLYELISIETDKGFITRIAFLGKVGVGKSTIFSKMALDWAMGESLDDINLLFLISFQDMEKNQSFGNIVINHFRDIKAIIGGSRIDQYIQNNQRKVVILIDDIDEKKMDLTISDGENAVISTVRGEIYTDTPVLITTLPYVVDLIKSDDRIRELFTLIEVKGFSKEGSFEYIDRFFKNDTASAVSLRQFIESNKQASEYLTPYPIFCSMLCHVWEKGSTQEALKKLGTFSQVLREIFLSLGEQSFPKHSRSTSYESYMRKAADTLISVGKIALEGLEQNQHVFKAEVVEPHMMDNVLTACDIGILSREKRSAHRSIRLEQQKQFIEEFSFPHKFLQEYAASSYLASLFSSNHLEFNRILTDVVIKDYNIYRYVLFFTAARGGKVAKSVMKALCQKVRDIDFIIRVAFECHDVDALDPIKKLLLHKRTIVPDHSNEHTFSASVFALETYRKEVIEAVKHRSTVSPSDAKMTYSDDRTTQYTKALFDLPNLRSLQLANSDVENEFFFATMAAEAQNLQIITLSNEGGRLNTKSSSHFSEAIVSMPHLHNLEMCDVELSSDKFYPKMADGASKSRIMSLKHEGGSLSSTASAKYAQAIVSMPNLQTLELSDVKLKDEFYPNLAAGASQSRIKKLKHVGGTLGPDASSHYAKGLSSMPNLQSLELESMKLHDDFYKRASTEAAKSNVEVLRHADAELGSVASSYYAQGLFSMPNLRSLELDKMELSPEFFSTMSAKSSTSEITRLRHVDGDLPSTSSYNYARGLFSMPHLRSLELIRMQLSGDFFKLMSSEASNSKIEKLKQTDVDLSHDASSHYARGLCSMPKLQSLELHNVKLKDEFPASLTGGPSRPKIQTLVMKMCTVNRRILRAMLSLPRLQSLSLIGNIDLPANINNKRTPTLGITSVNDLSLDCRSVADLWKLGLHTACQRVKKLTLYFYDEDLDSSETITTACSPFQYLTELHIHWQRAFDPGEFYNALRTSCPRLIKLTLTRIKMYNEKATEIIRSLTTLPHLTIVEMDSCWTDEYLDPIIAQVNNEGRLTVTVTHGPEETPEVFVYV